MTEWALVSWRNWHPDSIDLKACQPEAGAATPLSVKLRLSSTDEGIQAHVMLASAAASAGAALAARASTA